MFSRQPSPLFIHSARLIGRDSYVLFGKLPCPRWSAPCVGPKLELSARWLTTSYIAIRVRFSATLVLGNC